MNGLENEKEHSIGKHFPIDKWEWKFPPKTRRRQYLLPRIVLERRITRPDEAEALGCAFEEGLVRLECGLVWFGWYLFIYLLFWGSWYFSFSA